MKLINPIQIESLCQKQTQSPNIQLFDAITSAGLVPPVDLLFDGELHRFASNGKAGDKSGWYVAHNDHFAVATFGCWRMDICVNWRADIGRALTYIEQMAFNKRMAEAKAKRDAEKFEKNATAAETAFDILSYSSLAEDSHPYLTKKGIKAHGARVAGDGRLMIPVCSDGLDAIMSLQYIGADGHKMFLSGGAISGGWYRIGQFIGASQVFIAEGFATAASIHEVTGKPCAIAFNAGQLKTCAIKVRELVGDACTITICADLDPSGIGETKANEAAQAVGAKVIVSSTSSDFNDAVMAGVDIASILCPVDHSQDWLIHAGALVKSELYVKWLVKRWIPRNSLIMLHGASGSGKSLIVMDMVCRVALQHEGQWNGFKVRPGAVVYLAGEGYIGMNARLRAWAEHNSIDAETLNMWISRSGCDLNQSMGYQFAREAILSLPMRPAVIVVDTLHRFMGGADENSAQDAGEMIKACSKLMAEFNCSVLLVHHTGVSDAAQGRARGSSAWKGAMESEISIIPSVDGAPLEIVNIKSKDAALAETQYMRIQAHLFDGWMDEDGEAITGAIVVQADKIEKESKADSNDKKEFQRVAKVIHKILPDGRVWVSENDWSDATIDENGIKTAALRQSRQRMKKRMIEAGFIELVTNGYAANFLIDLIKSNA